MSEITTNKNTVLHEKDSAIQAACIEWKYAQTPYKRRICIKIWRT
jgi:hypothetical protein